MRSIFLTGALLLSLASCTTWVTVEAECEGDGFVCCEACAAGTEVPRRDGSCEALLCCESCHIEAGFPAELCVEAESGELTPPMVAVPHDDASHGTFVHTHWSYEGSVRFTFEVADPGRYGIHVLAITPEPLDGHDSLYVGDDETEPTGDSRVYDIVDSEGFAWDAVRLRGDNGTELLSEYDPMEWDLEVGFHSFTFAGRENLAGIDQVVLRRCPEEGCEAIEELGCIDEEEGN